MIGSNTKEYRRKQLAYWKAKRKFEKKLSNNIQNNPKSFYSYVRSTDAVSPDIDNIGQMVVRTV